MGSICRFGELLSDDEFGHYWTVHLSVLNV